MQKFIETFGFFTVALVIVVAVAFLYAFPVMWAVNYLFAPSALVAVFGVPEITFGRALCLVFVCSSLFKATAHGKAK